MYVVQKQLFRWLFPRFFKSPKLGGLLFVICQLFPCGFAPGSAQALGASVNTNWPESHHPPQSSSLSKTLFPKSMSLLLKWQKIRMVWKRITKSKHSCRFLRSIIQYRYLGADNQQFQKALPNTALLTWISVRLSQALSLWIDLIPNSCAPASPTPPPPW